MQLIPLYLILSPIIGIILGLIVNRYSLWAVLSSLVNVGLSIYLFESMIAGKIIKSVYHFSIFPIGIYFKIDLLGYIFVAIVSLVWLLASVYSIAYIKPGKKANRYYGFLMLTFSAMMGVFVTGDFVSLFLFFEIMTLASYVLVVHNEDRKARYGGSYYLFMGIFGGLLILWGVVFLYNCTGSVIIKSALIQLQSLSFLKYFIAGLLIVGFGVKAGMFPVHIWLPKAHPVAPAPASALLSGIIIKAGAYGILRVITTLYWPLAGYHNSITGQSIGLITIVIGSITMFLGMVNALLQQNVKRMLAYSSISQMGYILVGVGIAGYLGTNGTLGFAGALYHIINHALFKSSIFLIIGAIYFVSHEANLKRLGGMGRQYPLITFSFIVAMLGITGFPGFNGYASKTLLHHGLLEALHLTDNIWILVAEKIFIITSAGTLCYFLKIAYYVFFRKMPDDLSDNLSPMPLIMQIVSIVFSLLIIILGIIPKMIIVDLFSKLYPIYNFNLKGIHHISFWGSESLSATVGYLIGGGLFFVIGLKRSWFNYTLPQWFNLEENYKKVAKMLIKIYQKLVNILVPFKEAIEKIPDIIYNSLVKVDRNPEGETNGLTIQSIDFSKLVVACMLTIILLWLLLVN